MVDLSNHRSLLEPIGNIPPAKGEDKYYVAADNIDMSSVTHNLMPPADPAQSGWPTRRCLQAYSKYD
jgi:hypothetical protein